MNAVDFLFENSSKLKKDFVVGVEENITYHELYTAVNKLAFHISSHVGSGKEILLLSENNSFFIIIYLAIIKSGNIAVLLETGISKKHFDSILSIISPAAYFIQDKHVPESFFAKNIFNEEYVEKIITQSKPSEKKFHINNNDNDVAVIIFTSGSTGGKKGVMLTHKNICVNTTSIISYLKLTKQDRIAVVLPFFYCYGLSLLHTHLCVGGSMVLHKGIFLGSVIQEIKKYLCTGFAGVPATFQILIAKTDFLSQDFPSLRYMTQAGGKLEDKYIDAITTAFTNKLFFVMYGATEATARLSFLPPHLTEVKRGSIGRGISGVTLEVVDTQGILVHPGTVGEIRAKGDNIMKGYYKEDKDTSSVLRDSWYYTGDMATVDKDGYIYIVGRASNIIKSAGHRISPHELEELVNTIEGISDSVAVGIQDEIVGESIALLVETEQPSEKIKEDIYFKCRKHLASYKVPRKIYFIDTLPLNTSHKIDRMQVKSIILKKISLCIKK